MTTRRTAALALTTVPMISSAVKIIEIDKESKTEPRQPEPAPSRAIQTDSEMISEEAVRILSYTIYAEARGEPYEGQKAVASVIHTRSQQLHIPMAEVCRQEKQFSCWNSISEVPSFYGPGKGLKHADVKARNTCYTLAWLLVSGYGKWDYLTHFYNPAKANPSWRRDMQGVKTIGNHVFGYIR
ncbi:cell wall hydrolase [Pontiellaceae bacterium B12227]|nr:cell wall hydrolase [Pontiellaceae bacterium B12227]